MFLFIPIVMVPEKFLGVATYINKPFNHPLQELLRIHTGKLIIIILSCHSGNFHNRTIQ